MKQNFIICSFIWYHSIAYRTKSFPTVLVYFRSHGYETPGIINSSINRVEWGNAPTWVRRLLPPAGWCMKRMSQPVFFTSRDCAEEAWSVIWRVWYVLLIFSEHKLFFAPLDVKLSWLQAAIVLDTLLLHRQQFWWLYLMSGLRGIIKAMPCSANAPRFSIFLQTFSFTRG